MNNNISKIKLLISKLKIIIFSKSFLKYLIIGFSTYGIDFLIYNILDIFSPIKDINANLISSFTSLIFNFSMSNFWTFRAGNTQKIKKIKKYTTLAIANYIFGNLAFYVLYYQLHINDNLTKIITLGCIVSWNYFLYRFWVFK